MHYAGRRWYWRPEKRRHLVVLAWVISGVSMAILWLPFTKGIM